MNLQLKKGFTLIELLVVIAIIGILAVVILSALSSARKSARDSKRAEETRNVMTAIEAYIAANGSNPAAVGDMIPDYLASNPETATPRYIYKIYWNSPDQYCVVSEKYEAKKDTYFYAKNGVSNTAPLDGGNLPASYALCP